MYSFVSGLSAVRVVVMVDVISLRVGRCRLPQKTFFRYLEIGFAPWAVCQATVPKTPEELLIPRESLLPGTVLGPADPQSWAQPFSPSLWTYSGICTWPLGLEALLFSQQSLLLLASGSYKTHSLTFVSFSTLLHQQWHGSQFFAGPAPDPGCFFCSSGHYRSVTNWVGQLLSHMAPSGDPEVPVWVMGTLQSK